MYGLFKNSFHRLIRTTMKMIIPNHNKEPIASFTNMV